MDSNPFLIYVEQLHRLPEEELSLRVAPDFLDIPDFDLRFIDQVVIQGKAYLADSALVLQLNISTHALIPCRICNEPVRVDIDLENMYHLEPLSELRSGTYDFRNAVREALILEAPTFAECNQGSCPKRKEMAHYMAGPNKKRDEEQNPFAHL